MHGAGADPEQRDRQPDPEQLVGQPKSIQVGEEAQPGAQLHHEIADDEEQGAERGQAEQGGHLPLGPFRGLRVGIGHPGPVRGEAGVGEPLGDLRPVGSDPGAVVFNVVSTHRSTSLVAHADFAPSHTAKPISAVSPTNQATRPSLTGPIRPRDRPPGFGVLLIVVR